MFTPAAAKFVVDSLERLMLEHGAYESPFIAGNGRRWWLEVNQSTCEGELAGDVTKWADGPTMKICDNRLQLEPGVELEADERAWLTAGWLAATGQLLEFEENAGGR